MLQEETLQKIDGQNHERSYEEPDGELIEMIDSGRNTITVLTRADPNKAEEVPPPVDPGNYTISELKDVLGDETWDEESLDLILEAEKEGKNRKTAIKAIQNQ